MTLTDAEHAPEHLPNTRPNISLTRTRTQSERVIRSIRLGRNC